MRLLFGTHDFHPEVGAAPTRILELAQELFSHGHEVTVLTGFPNYPDGMIPTSYRGRRFQLERLGDLRVVRTAVYPAPNRGVARRLLNHTSFALSAVATAEVTVATQRDLPLLADALSTKVLEYTAAARPVAAAASGWTAEVVAAAEAGIVCPPEQPEALAEAIAGLTADAGRARAMGLNGRRYVETNLTPRVAVERIEPALHSMVDA